MRDAHPECLVHRARPFRVALREVVVDGHEVHALAEQRVQVQRLHGDEGLPLARLHLCDVALVQDDAAHQLDVEQANADRPLEGLAYRGERLEEDVVELLAVLEPLAELGRFRAQLVVRERLEVRLERPDVCRLLSEPLEPAALAHAEEVVEGGHGPRVAGSVAVPAHAVSAAHFRRTRGHSPHVLMRHPQAGA